MFVPCLVVGSACMIGIFTPGEGSGDRDDGDAWGRKVGSLDGGVTVVRQALKCGEIESIICSSLMKNDLSAVYCEVMEIARELTAAFPNRKIKS